MERGGGGGEKRAMQKTQVLIVLPQHVLEVLTADRLPSMDSLGASLAVLSPNFHCAFPGHDRPPRDGPRHGDAAPGRRRHLYLAPAAARKA